MFMVAMILCLPAAPSRSVCVIHPAHPSWSSPRDDHGIYREAGRGRVDSVNTGRLDPLVITSLSPPIAWLCTRGAG